MTPVEEIKQKLDLVDYIKQHVQLSKSGASWKGLCPFHKEKVPSFYVSPVKQFWYCFGCHRGGDIFKFAMEIEHFEFAEALKLLAEKAGVELRREDPQLRTKKIRLLDVLEKATAFYEKNLEKESAPSTYLRERGLTDATLQGFKIGFAPPGWRNLYDHLSGLGFTPEEMESAGLILRQQTSTDPNQPAGYYDRFRSRIMFPVFDTNSRVIGFSGRIFGEAEEGGKYINTSETLLFNKGHTLYGLEHAKNDIRNEGKAILVEGQMDFLMAWQDGVKNVVASSGTALTWEQLGTLKRLSQELILLFDMDAAGSEATERSISRASQRGFSVKVATLPAGKDAADFSKAFPGKLAEVIGKALPAMEYFFMKAFSNTGVATLEEKKAVVTYLLPRIKSLASPVEQAHWVEQVARKLKVEERILHEELKRTPPLESETPSAPILEAPSYTTLLQGKTRWDILGERALSLALKMPDRPLFFREYVSYFPLPLQEFAKKVSHTNGDPETLSGSLPQEVFNYLLLRGDYEVSVLAEDRDIAEELSLTLKELRREKVRNALRELGLAIQEAEYAKNDERVKTLMQEFNQLSKELVTET